MPTTEQVLAVARSQLGTVEDARGRQKYGAWYGMDGVAWCAIFTQWVFAQVGGSGLIPRTAYTPTYYSWFVTNGGAGKVPRPGALVFYDWPDSIRRIQHVGIVEAVNADGSITTIEGNTTSGAAGDQSNGGGVWRRRRTTSAVVGYGYPAYVAPPPTPTARPAPTLAPAPAPRPEDHVRIPITLDAAGRFHEAVGAEAGGGSRYTPHGVVTFGSTYGGTTWTVAALAADGRVLAYWKDVRTTNNNNADRPLPDGTRAVTVEGQADNAGTRPWASYWPVP